MSRVSAVAPTRSSARVASYGLPSRSVSGSPELRLDAGNYNPDFLHAIRILRESGMRIERLADVAEEVFIPPRFRRVYVAAEHGVPFLQGSHIVHLRPADLKYLSRSAHRLEPWIVRSGWILVTCSGTIGRTMICPNDFDGWAASQHILRIVPDASKCPSGYLASYLTSFLGQVQLAANSYGAVVDELTEEQAERILVPLPETDEDRALVRSVDASMQDAVVKRAEAADLVGRAIAQVGVWSEPVGQPIDFSLRTRYLMGDELRLDAGHYSPVLLDALRVLEPLNPVRLGDVAHVSMPSRFKRIYVDADFGVPFLQGSHVIQFLPSVKYLSSDHPKMAELRVSAGWVLVTRSGTVGRVTVCPEEWHGWSATEDIIRVVPDESRCPVGYLYSFLASPVGQVQLTSQIHGAVVDHLTEDHIKNVLVPLPEPGILEEIDGTMMSGIAVKSEAVAAARSSLAQLEGRFSGIR